MQKNPTKEAGNNGPCFKCGVNIFCNEVEYKGTKKLQWQGEDGKAHYSFDVTTNITSCKSKVSEIYHAPTVQPEANIVWEKLYDKSDDQQLLLDALREFRSLAYEFTKEGHPELLENTNLFGQIVNANITHLIGLAHIIAIKESE